ncbi:MAG: CDP-alcohol phosphatidyltransferase family protein [Bacteroidota bacterium]
MSIKRHIPNAITCCNLLCGCLAIVQSFEGNLVNAAYLVSLALIFDFFDGFAARMLRVASPIGKDLDSLADMATFGVVPGVVMFKLLKLSIISKNYPDLFLFGINKNASQFDLSESFSKTDGNTMLLPYAAFFITIFSAIRLAKFNNDLRQSDSFIGVPTPANAILICSLPLVINAVGPVWFNPYVLVIISVIMSLLLISEIPLFALKFKFFGWRGNRIRYTFLGLSALLLITLQFVGIPLIIILYILMSVITNFYMKRRTV